MQRWGCCFLLQFLLSPAVLCWVQQYRGDQEAALLLQLLSCFVLDNLGLLREGEKNGLEGRGGGKNGGSSQGVKPYGDSQSSPTAAGIAAACVDTAPSG